ncbi:GNAT family N-acetyltransferase [Actinoplanes palleronii]|uniref:N-acetyltransferase n=1 Tax=Actinoplanes palleronii TaxID=113570 RepID=A0ABQ4BPF5_9ACTN|nr:GNAT family N-acetyltransferase [Actinoplanes palleronii]GIE72558.1 N-acetyltransferase [Actinoplanes palleronii]
MDFRSVPDPAWTWIAEEHGRVLARAGWWGRPGSAQPVLLDSLWVDDTVTDRAELAGRLLGAAYRSFSPSPEAFRITLPNGWRDDPAARAAVAWQRDAAAAIGFTHEVERLQLAWTPAAGVAADDGRLVFTAEPDDRVILGILRRIGDGSLDDETRKNRARMSAEETARRELDFYLNAPGERDWWRTVRTPGGTLAGLAIPSATASHPNVGFLGVVPELRGRGYARTILAAITRGHASRGAERITASTDVTNVPMAAAFRAAGYSTESARLMLSAS